MHSAAFFTASSPVRRLRETHVHFNVLIRSSANREQLEIIRLFHQHAEPLSPIDGTADRPVTAVFTLKGFIVCLFVGQSLHTDDGHILTGNARGKSVILSKSTFEVVDAATVAEDRRQCIIKI